MSEKRLVVIGSGGQAFREYALEAMAGEADLVLLENREPTWQKPHITDFRVVDPADVAALVEAVREVAPDGLLTYDESLVDTVALVAAEVGIAHTSPEAIRLCKDKSALRGHLAEAGLSPVRFAVAHTGQEAVDAAGRIGFPLVCKPLALGGSIGVVRADDEAGLREAFAIAATAKAGDGTASKLAGVLLEEYLEGPEFSVDCVVWDGVAHPLVVAEKVLGFPPYFEELGHVVPAEPSPAIDEAVRLVREAHRAVGLDRLVTHTEFRLTPDGPRIIEINVRLGGDLIPLLGKLASGVDLAASAARVAVGLAPETGPLRSEVAAIVMVYPDRAYRVEGVRLRRDEAEYPGLERLTTFLPPGTEVRLPPEGFLSRLGFAIVTGADRRECLERRDAVAADLVVDGTPL
ncbi:ATP-grasp domain-containing protein [Actinosynnema pretiosum subsp. pretiosum]|uniref:ATP-grasp domain-containing protein n=1 Tax=Actinosynnema pretiosum subsp. pretiosum TaxID=103721 RepID=A0AA45L6Z6_9PSEU|nr:carboxylase [Actinosynnema pretiosum subsp. pretiosum]QUF04003.1 ATP-grasp domain-containing protein [Actinosynnema pretiosum subsp. pretiosum]